MADLAKYKVLEDCNLEGTAFTKDQEVELTAEQAEQLSGKVEKLADADAPADAGEGGDTPSGDTPAA